MTDEQALLDRDVIGELRDSVGGDDEFVRELIATYLAEGPDHLAQMASAAAASDAAAIIRPAHTLKSSSASLGAMRLAAVAREIEFCGRAGDTDGLGSRVTAAHDVWEATVSEIRRAGLA